eukprot:3938379-Rhodomonas_salina.1
MPLSLQICATAVAAPTSALLFALTCGKLAPTYVYSGLKMWSCVEWIVMFPPGSISRFTDGESTCAGGTASITPPTLRARQRGVGGAGKVWRKKDFGGLKRCRFGYRFGYRKTSLLGRTCPDHAKERVH